MPWLAVDFKNAELRETLSQLFAVEGIPRLVMLSPEGVLNPSAKDDVLANENGFPWKQPTVKELVAPNVRKGDAVVEMNLAAFRAGYEQAKKQIR